MAYNMNYTTLPDFSQNSIGYIVKSQNYTTAIPSFPISFPSVIPGVYLFTCTIGYNNPVGGSVISFNLTNTTPTSIISYYSDYKYNNLGSPINVCGTLSQVFTLTSTSTLNLINTSNGFGVSLSFISYSLVRIA